MKAEMEEMQKKGTLTGSGGAADTSMQSFSFENVIDDADSKQYKTSTSLDGWLEGQVRRNELSILAK